MLLKNLKDSQENTDHTNTNLKKFTLNIKPTNTGGFFVF